MGEILAIWGPRFQMTSDLRFVIWSTYQGVWFRKARFRAMLVEFCFLWSSPSTGENSASSSEPIICVPKRCDSPDPRHGPEPPFSGKGGFGVQKPPFPSALTRAGKGIFRSKNPHFRCVPLQKKVTENSLFQDEGKWGFWTPKPSFLNPSEFSGVSSGTQRAWCRIQ